MADSAITVLMDLYKENTTHGRQHETQRQLVTAAIVALDASLLAVMSALKFHPASLPLAAVVTMTGFIGKRFSEKFFERFKYHTTMAKWFRERLNAMCPDAQIEVCRERARAEHAKEFPGYDEQRLNKLWLTLNSIVIWLGGLCCLIVFANCLCRQVSGKYLFE
jgi:hypothetical protein